MYKNILVIGMNGQLGSEFQVLSQKYTHYNFTFTDKSTLDLGNAANIEKYFDDKNFDLIINCAAYTAVDKAEEETELADSINHKGASLLAKIAKRKAIALIHISTDYVFDGQNFRPYTESDTTSAQSVYGQSKLDGEKAILSLKAKNTLIIRTSWVYSSFGNNFVKTMLRLAEQRDELGIIFDQVGTPTYARDLARTILEIYPSIDNDAPEIYHYSNEGVASWYDFAKTIFELSDINCKVHPIETKDYPTAATRPYYSVLNKSKIKKDFNIQIPYWKDALTSCLKTLKENHV